MHGELEPRFKIHPALMRELRTSAKLVLHIDFDTHTIGASTIFGEEIADDNTISAYSAERIKEVLESITQIRPVFYPIKLVPKTDYVWEQREIQPFTSWEEIEQELFTPEEIEESHDRVANTNLNERK